MNAYCACDRVGPGEAEVVGHAGPAVRPDGKVDDLTQHIRRGHLDHGDLGQRGFITQLVHRVRGLQHQQAGLVDSNPCFGDTLKHHGLLGQRLAEGDAGTHSAAHLLERYLGLANRTHAVMNAARPKPSLRNLEAATLT